MLSAQRARDISAGAPLTVDRDNDKNPVVALREIAEDTIDLSFLEDELIRSQQKYVARDETEEDVPEFDALEGELEASARMASESLEGGLPRGGAQPELGGGEEGDEEGDEEGSPSLEELAEREATAEEADESGEDRED